MTRSIFVEHALRNSSIFFRSNTWKKSTAKASSLLLRGSDLSRFSRPLSESHCVNTNLHRRWYTPMTKDEEDREKARVSHLSPEEKEKELRQLNREIAKLETIRGINTGELYTWSGRYKSLVKNYGMPLFIYYWSLWLSMGGLLYLGIDYGGLDAMALLQRIDTNLGWSVSEKVDPQMGQIGVALILNECLEPVRLPFVVVTLKPVMDIISPPKY